MTSSLPDDALKVGGLNVSIFVGVKMQERLSNALALQPAQHLRKLWVRHSMTVLLGANVQSGPLGLPIEGQALLCLVHLPCLVELVEVDVAGAFLVEEAEDDLVLGVWLREQVLEDTPVMDVDLSLLLAVCDLEQDAVLVALDLVLRADAPLASPCLRPGHIAGAYAYVVFASGRNSINEGLFVKGEFAGRLVFVGVPHKRSARKGRQLRLVGSAQQRLTHFLLEGSHGE